MSKFFHFDLNKEGNTNTGLLNGSGYLALASSVKRLKGLFGESPHNTRRAMSGLGSGCPDINHHLGQITTKYLTTSSQKHPALILILDTKCHLLAKIHILPLVQTRGYTNLSLSFANTGCQCQPKNTDNTT